MVMVRVGVGSVLTWFTSNPTGCSHRPLAGFSIAVLLVQNLIAVILRSALVEDEEAQTSPALAVFFLPYALQFLLSLLVYTPSLPQVLLDTNQLLTNITHTYRSQK